MQIDKKGQIYGYVTWFDCDFSHGEKVITLSTSPYRKTTHWKQTIFYLEKPFDVEKGDIVKGSLKVQKAQENIRELNVTLKHWHNERTKGEQYYRIS